MFGWFRRKKKPDEVMPPVRAIHPHDLIRRVPVQTSPDRVIVIDHSEDMLTSPLYSYLPGNIWHHTYQAEMYSRSNEPAYSYTQPVQAPEPAPTQSWVSEPYVAPDPTPSCDSSTSFDTGGCSSDSGGGGSSD